MSSTYPWILSFFKGFATFFFTEATAFITFVLSVLVLTSRILNYALELLLFDVSVLGIIYLPLLKLKLSFFFFPLQSRLICILSTSPIFERQFVKNCEGSKISCYLQANKFACQFYGCQ